MLLPLQQRSTTRSSRLDHVALPSPAADGRSVPLRDMLTGVLQCCLLGTLPEIVAKENNAKKKKDKKSQALRLLPSIGSDKRANNTAQPTAPVNANGERTEERRKDHDLTTTFPCARGHLQTGL